MAQEHHFSTPTTPAGAGSDTTIGVVQVRSEHSFQEAAALGEAPIVSIRVDDPAAALDFPGLKRWYVNETTAPAGDKLIWTGYINDQGVDRGSSGTLFPRAAGRQWDLELEEVNSILGFRVISGEDGDRPAETAGERLTWLLAGSDYLATVGDNGLVDYPDDDLDENDYRGQFGQDVLSDIAVQTGYLFFVFYDKDADDDQRISLFFKDPNTLDYPAAITSISNYGDADGLLIFAPWEDARLNRSPSRVAAGVYLPYAGGAVYEYDLDTSYAFGFRDRVAPMASVKTEDKATELALRFLSDNAEQDDRITCRITTRAADINLIKRGQHLAARFQHLEGYEALTNFRVIRKTWQPPDNRTQAFYDIDLELSPIAPAPSGAAAFYEYAVPYGGIPILPRETTPGNLLILALTGIGPTSTYPDDPRFLDGPSLVVPPVPPYADAGGWTVLGIAKTDFGGMATGGPCTGYDPVGSPCTAGTSVAIAWRYVQPGEVTDHPVAAGWEDAHINSGVWLWEFPTTEAPGATVVSDDDHASGTSATAALPLLTGNVLALFAWAQVGYGHSPVASAASAGTLVQSAGADNNPAFYVAPPDNRIPWNQIVHLPDGGAAGASITAEPGYGSGLNWCGVAIQLPASITTVPTIPYPANQVEIA